ncbi:MAG TPA: glucose 1-dehydrogenase [Candidatus Binataceae bacterium]|jgi:3alpha(or 20beta)-hydroxysteroid dehydrogenase|nr:glucose 1-dehydrogenase [Candidatus Binataceae bacterium]
MGKLQDKVAIITGGARGMGAATSRLFAAEGARVVIADVLDREGDKLAQELGSAAHFRHHDVTDEESWRGLIADTKRRWGRIDVLVNNAGVVLFRTILDTEKTEFEMVLSINLVGTFLGIKSMASVMTDQGKGSIINISSVDGMKGCNGLGAYAASKWGVRGLTKVAAMELGPHGIRVNSIHPGGINTMMGNPAGSPEAEANQAYAGQPIQRIGAPEEVARTTVFLASDDASYICGAEIAVDGGMTVGQYQPMLPGAPSRK